MTREEEIKQKAEKYAAPYRQLPDCTDMQVFSAFTAGARWADRHPLPSPWFSVHDKMPDLMPWGESKMVFVHIVGIEDGEEWIEMPARFNAKLNDWIASDYSHLGKHGRVTHWMHIPKCPNE